MPCLQRRTARAQAEFLLEKQLRRVALRTELKRIETHEAEHTA